MNKRRFIFVLVVIVALASTAFYLRTPRREAGLVRGHDVASSSMHPELSVAKPAARLNPHVPQGGMDSSVPRHGEAHHSELRDFADLTSEMDGQGSIAAAFYALTPQESIWMDAQGAMRKDEGNFEPYVNLDLDEVSKRAQQGDVTAAVFGAQRSRMIALSQLSKAERNTLMQGADDEKRAAAEKLFTSELWKQQRELLWDGVTFGSSIAAELMAISYTTVLGSTCSAGGEVAAWMLVSWRMGNWNVGAAVNCDDQLPNLGGSIQLANQLWDRINYLRAEKGLGPLPLDLRPNHAEWLQLRLDSRKQVPVYRR
ncbi:MAG TPA: hypothetical protein VFN09_10995 [Rhodanobacteraceae bacterium]|nr:hypothetical protein [Rhodanobacteraceae bacterium]